MSNREPASDFRRFSQCMMGCLSALKRGQKPPLSSPATVMRKLRKKQNCDEEDFVPVRFQNLPVPNRANMEPATVWFSC